MIGAMRELIEVYDVAKVTDGQGGWTAGARTLVMEADANVEELSIEKRAWLQQYKTDYSHKVIIQAVPGVSVLQHMEVDWIRDDGTRTLRVEHVTDLKNQGRFLALMCFEVAEAA